LSCRRRLTATEAVMMADAALEARLFSPPFMPKEALRPQPGWPRIHAELRRPGVTLMLLWRNTGSSSRRATATATSAISTRTGAAACRRLCGRTISPATSCSSTSPGRRWR
jgi:transposase